VAPHYARGGAPDLAPGRLGDWEGDLITGRNNRSAISGTFFRISLHRTRESSDTEWRRAKMALVTVNDDETEDGRSTPRWSAGKKLDVVLRLLRGEKLDALTREIGVDAHRIAAWRDDFLSGGKEAQGAAGAR